jgi:hypothetical protein
MQNDANSTSRQDVYTGRASFGLPEGFQRERTERGPWANMGQRGTAFPALIAFTATYIL